MHNKNIENVFDRQNYSVITKTCIGNISQLKCCIFPVYTPSVRTYLEQVVVEVKEQLADVIVTRTVVEHLLRVVLERQQVSHLTWRGETQGIK